MTVQINHFTADPIKALHFAWSPYSGAQLVLSVKSAQMLKIKNTGLDQYGAEPFKQQQFGPAGVEGVKRCHVSVINGFEKNIQASWRQHYIDL